MKKSILILIASILLSCPINLLGADFETPHEFKSGDTISADMMNELFDNIRMAKTTINSSDLVGSWSCELTIRYSSDHATGWTADSDSLYQKLTTTITFSADGDGTYSYQSTAPNPFFAYDDRAISGHKYAVLSNSFYFTFPRKDQNGTIASDDKAIYYLSKTSRNSYVFLRGGATDISPDSLICDKLDLEPKPPSSLTNATSSSSITLTWTDSQTEAVTGYKVLRKKVVTDNFTTVSTITDNATRTYADTDVSTGAYWYRVRAYNTNGDGTPSKLVKLDFP